MRGPLPILTCGVCVTVHSTREAQRESRSFLNQKNPTAQKQKYYFQEYCLHICVPQEWAGNDTLHILEQKVLNSCRKLLRKETHTGPQLLPAFPAPSRIQSSLFQAVPRRDGQFIGTDWVARCCFSRWRMRQEFTQLLIQHTALLTSFLSNSPQFHSC